MQSRLSLGVWLCLLVTQLGCASNPYSFGREYRPSDDEESYFGHTVDVSYEEVRRDPQAFKGKLLGWFGVVNKMAPQAGGATRFSLDLRFHQPRHLCSDEFESSCRVTISDRDGGPFSTAFIVRGVDREGAERLNVGSLVKIYGTPTGDFDDRGGPILNTEFYRQWPSGAYVTTIGKSAMRR